MFLRRDNRTAHCNCPAELARPNGGGHELLRATVYVCMSPRAAASPEAIAERQASYNHHLDLGLHAAGHTYRQSVDDPQFDMGEFQFDEHGIPVAEELPWLEEEDREQQRRFRRAPRARLDAVRRAMVPL